MNPEKQAAGTSDAIYEEVMAHARNLASLVREHIAIAEEQRRQPENIVRTAVDAGLIRLLMPKRWRGYEASFDVFVDAVLEIAKVDGSAGWCFGFLMMHAWFLAYFPIEAQQDVWSDNPDVPLATALTPNGRFTHDANGYRLEGNWPWSSGVDYCEWNMLSALPVSGKERPGPRIFLLPRSDYQIHDTWFVAGLKASGSKNVLVKNAFIPKHRSIHMYDLIVGKSADAEIAANSRYNLPLFAAFNTALVSPILGATIGAYEVWRETSKSKYTAFSRERVTSLTHQQIRLAETAAEIDCALALLRRNLDTIREGGPLLPEVYTRNRRDYAYIALLCTRAIERLYTNSGGSANYETNPLQRHWRDVHAMAAHAALNFDRAAEEFGRCELGLPPNPSDIHAIR